MYVYVYVKVKPIDRQSYLHNKSEHSNSTKKKIAYSQALRFNKICNNRSDRHKNCKRLLTLIKRGYNKSGTATQINRDITIPRNELLKKLKHLILNAYHLLLRLTGF